MKIVKNQLVEVSVADLASLKAEVQRDATERGFATVVEISSRECRAVYGINLEYNRFVPVKIYRRLTGDTGCLN